MKRNVTLPALILLNDYSGNYYKYIERVYSVFKQDFIERKTKFRDEELRLKKHPLYQEKAYTFYHITHKGKDEQNRLPDLRRCERIPWTSPTIENCDYWSLKIWPQIRTGKGGTSNRLCIWLERINEPDYIIILDVRKNYKHFGLHLYQNTITKKEKNKRNMTLG